MDTGRHHTPVLEAQIEDRSARPSAVKLATERGQDPVWWYGSITRKTVGTLEIPAAEEPQIPAGLDAGTEAEVRHKLEEGTEDRDRAAQDLGIPDPVRSKARRAGMDPHLYWTRHVLPTIEATTTEYERPQVVDMPRARAGRAQAASPVVASEVLWRCPMRTPALLIALGCLSPLNAVAGPNDGPTSAHTTDVEGGRVLVVAERVKQFRFEVADHEPITCVGYNKKRVERFGDYLATAAQEIEDHSDAQWDKALTGMSAFMGSAGHGWCNLQVATSAGVPRIVVEYNVCLGTPMGAALSGAPKCERKLVTVVLSQQAIADMGAALLR